MKTPYVCSLFLMALFILGTGSTLVAQAQTVENPNYEQDIQLVTGYLEALSAGDLDMAKTKLHNRFMHYGPAESDSANATQELARWAETNKNYSDININHVTHSWRVEEGTYKGDWVAVWGTYQATHKTLNKTISLPFHTISRVESGKIRVLRGYWDNAGAVTQLGGTISVPGTEDGN